MVDKDLWLDAMQRVRQMVSPRDFRIWFAPLRFKRDNDRGVVEVPNRFFAEWIEDRYRPMLDQALAHAADEPIELIFKVAHQPEVEPPRPAPARTTHLPGALNPRYTFETFVVGLCNELAHAACRAVAERPSEQYNPLFLYGAAGLGKTHLISAVGNHLLKHKHKMRLQFCSSETFTNELIQAVRFEGISSFQEKYRRVDCLLLDDIQFLAGRERTQEEFFHTFNDLYDAGKQIVVTSDKIPRDIKGLEKRLRSRFEWGLIADLQLPDDETKVAILQGKAAERGLTLSRQVAFFLASQPQSSIRVLEGYLNRIMAVSRLQGVEITLEMAKRVLGPLVDTRPVTVEEVIQVTAKHYGLRPSDLRSARKSREVSHPRQVAMYLARRHTKASFPEIGQAFGGKDHSTAVHAVKRVKTLLSESGEVAEQVRQVERSLLEEPAEI